MTIFQKTVTLIALFAGINSTLISAAGSIIEYDGSQNYKSGKVILDFYAPWCGPCKSLAPRLNKVAELHPEVRIIKINVDKHAALSSEFNVNSMPTLIFMNNGSIKTRIVGNQTETHLNNLIKQHLS